MGQLSCKEKKKKKGNFDTAAIIHSHYAQLFIQKYLLYIIFFATGLAAAAFPGRPLRDRHPYRTFDPQWVKCKLFPILY
jgi:hypothetical protein